MPGSIPATSQLEWLISMTAMIVLFWSRATRDLLRSFGWGIAALHRLNAATKLPFPRRPPHSVSRSPVAKGCFRFGEGEAGKGHGEQATRCWEGDGFELPVPVSETVKTVMEDAA